MTPTTKNQLPNEAELLEIEQDLDTEDFLLEDLYELSGTFVDILSTILSARKDLSSLSSSRFNGFDIFLWF